PDNAQAWAARARVYRAQWRLDEAVRDLDEAVKRAPNDYGILSLRANLLGRSGKLDEAADAIRDLIERAPQFYEDFGTILTSFPQDEFSRRASRFAGLAGIDPRETVRQIASFAEGSEGVVRTLEADLGALEAQAHLKADDVNAAIADVDSAVERDPWRSGLW